MIPDAASPGLSRRFNLKAVSLFSEENSLIGRLYSLLRENNSLFDRVGNFDKNPKEGEAFSVANRLRDTLNRENSLYFP